MKEIPKRPNYDDITTPEELALENYYRYKDVVDGGKLVYSPVMPLYTCDWVETNERLHSSTMCSFGGISLPVDEWNRRYDV